MVQSKNKRGFTLVELIVVLVILAVLAALLIPSLTGYIDKARQQSVISEARGVWTAAQAGSSECYGLYANDATMDKTFKFTVTIDGKKYTDAARISNCSLYDEQTQWHTTDYNTSQKIAQEILIYLESRNKKNAQYSFGSTRLPLKGKTLEENMNYIFYNGVPDNGVFVLLFYDKATFKVLGLNFGKDGYLVTMTADSIKCEKNGKIYNYTSTDNT